MNTHTEIENTRKQTMKVPVIATIVLALGLSMIASAQDRDDCVPGKPEPVFSVPAGQDTEIVAVAHNGDVFTVEMYSGTVYRIDSDGKAKVIATLFPAGKYPPLSMRWDYCSDTTGASMFLQTRGIQQPTESGRSIWTVVSGSLPLSLYRAFSMGNLHMGISMRKPLIVRIFKAIGT